MATTKRARGRSARGRATRALPACRTHPHLFQINTWAWLDALSAAAGRDVRLADVPDSEWDAIRERGFDLVYLLGVWQRSVAGRHIFRTNAAEFPGFDHALPGWTVRSVVGSPFSIRDYVPDARIGTWADLDAVRDKLHDRGMRLILDFIPNHTGPDHVWIADHPDYFLRGTEADFHRDPAAFHLVEPEGGEPIFVARGRDPYFAPWADTAQLDYYDAGARAAFVEALRAIATHCDGLRCDMAMLVLNDVFARTWGHLLRDRAAPAREFWEDAIPALPDDFIWMAEVYWDMEARLQALGFDYTYDKRLYDRLRGAPAPEVRAHLGADLGYQTRMARFIENHDEPRCVSAFGRDRVPGLAAMIATLPGLRFFHQGQLEGRSIHLPMPLDSAADEAPDLDLLAHYERTLRLADDGVFHDGEWRLLEVEPDNDASHANLVAYRWRRGDRYRLVVVNLAGATSQGRLRIAGELESASRYAFTDELADRIYERDRDDLERDGLYVRLDAHGAHAFAVTPLP